MRPLRWLLALTAAIAAIVMTGEPIARWTLSFRILDELRRPGPRSWLRRATPSPTRATIVLATARGRCDADLYRPGARASGIPVILVPGLVEQGKDDPRVPPFAELLARAGFPVVVPDLPSFRALRIHPDNLAELLAAVDAILDRPELAPLGRAGLFGVSYGGGMSVLAALDLERADRLAFVGAVGAYADLDTALRFLATGETFLGGRMRRVPPDPYGQLVFLRTYEDFLPDARDRELLEEMVTRRWRDPAAQLADLAVSLSPDARLLYDLFETAPPDEVARIIDRLPAALRDRIAGLSPGRRRFDRLAARLYLAHDRDDGTFPLSEAYRLAELARPRVPVRLVVLDELRHVELEPSRGSWIGRLTRELPEALRLAAWWYHFLGERRPAPRT